MFVSARGVMPMVELKGIVARLPEFERGDEEPELVASSEGYEILVVEIPATWTLLVASTPDEQLRAAAHDYRESPGNAVQGKPNPLTTSEGLGSGMIDIASLARCAMEDGSILFCWICC